MRSPPDLVVVFRCRLMVARARSATQRLVRVTCVVQMPSPCAMVASRCTGVPSSARTPRSRPRTAAGTRRPRAPPGSGAGRAASPARGLALRGRGGVAVRRQRLGQRLDRLSAGRPSPITGSQALSRLGHLAPGELGHRVRAHALGQEAQRAAGQVVVGVLEGAPPRVGDDEHLGRAAAAALAVAAARVRTSIMPSASRRVQMAADGGGREPEPLAQRGRGDGPCSRMSRATRARVLRSADSPGAARRRSPRCPTSRSRISQHQCAVIPSRVHKWIRKRRGMDFSRRVGLT